MSRPVVDPDLKRLADRPRDRADLDELREIHGELPTDPLPGLDSE